MLKAILVVSKDGYVARSEKNDDLSWTGKVDRAMFSLLVSTADLFGIGKNTCDMMKPDLKGKNFRLISREGSHNLSWFYGSDRNAWLIGGQTLLVAALKKEYVGELHIIRSVENASPNQGEGIRERVTPLLLMGRKMGFIIYPFERHIG